MLPLKIKDNMRKLHFLCNTKAVLLLSIGVTGRKIIKGRLLTP